VDRIHDAFYCLERQSVKMRGAGDGPNGSESISSKLDHITAIDRDEVDQAAKVGV
jgi:hypothetical protein